MIPISSGFSPVFSIALALAISAATSTGALIGRRREIRDGNFTRISRITEGQAELMNGASSLCSLIYSRDASDTSSAAALTSYTSSKPSLRRALSTMSTLVRLLYCAYRDGAGSATVYLKLLITDSGS